MRMNMFMFVGIMVLAPLIGNAGLLDKVKSATSSTSPGLDITGLTTRESKLKNKIGAANLEFASALINVLDAAGSSATVAKLNTAADRVRANREDITALKELVAEVNAASGEINKMDLSKQLDATKAQAKLNESVLGLGAGLMLDTAASSEAKALSGEAADALKKAKASPSSANLSTMSSLQSVSATSRFAVESIPPQSAIVRKTSSKLTDYAKKRKFPLPSQADIDRKVKTLE